MHAVWPNRIRFVRTCFDVGRAAGNVVVVSSSALGARVERTNSPPKTTRVRELRSALCKRLRDSEL